MLRLIYNVEEKDDNLSETKVLSAVKKQFAKVTFSGK